MSKDRRFILFQGGRQSCAAHRIRSLIALDSSEQGLGMSVWGRDSELPWIVGSQRSYTTIARYKTETEAKALLGSLTRWLAGPDDRAVFVVDDFSLQGAPEWKVPE